MADELAPEALDDRVQRQLERLRARDEALALLAAEKASTTARPAVQSLAAFLDVPDEPARYRIDRLWPLGGRVVLAAPAKAGKTTLVGNLLRALADGSTFLGDFTTEPVGRIVLLDDELDPRMLRRWLRDQQIDHPERVDVVSLRGAASSFDILTAEGRAQWAAHLGPADVLILDCLRPVLDALGLDENREAGRFLEALDELTKAAGIPEVFVVHHTGHDGQRSRGDSRILDWPDASWRLERDAADEEHTDASAPRYFSAYGRDVDVPQALLALDGRHLRIAGGGRSTVRSSAALPDVLDVLRDAGEELTGRRIEEALADSRHSRQAVRSAIKAGVQAGQILTRPGATRSTLHRINPEYASAPECATSAPAHSEVSAPVRLIEAHRRTDAANGTNHSAPGGALICHLHTEEPLPGCWTCDGGEGTGQQ